MPPSGILKMPPNGINRKTQRICCLCCIFLISEGGWSVMSFLPNPPPHPPSPKWRMSDPWIKNGFKIHREGRVPEVDPYVGDIDSSQLQLAFNEYPCATCSRNAGHWIFNRGRRASLEELLRLQGMSPSTFICAVSDRQLGIQLGNTMSVNVLERLFFMLLPACLLVPPGVLRDNWADGSGLRRLVATRGAKCRRLC